MASVPATPESAHKALRDGRYVLLAPLGLGSQGTTWDAVDKREGRSVAVKAFDVRGAKAWKDVELAEREARVLAELEHPLLPRYIEHFEEDGVLYLVMEKVVGKPLSVLRKEGVTMGEKDVLRFLHDADRALTYLHGRAPPVVHRDLKPSNVIRRTDGSFAFVDFGAVRDRLRPEGGSTVVGTFGYMAPEQFQGRAAPASDVYSIGATALALLTGREPESLPHKGLAIDVDSALGGSTSPRIKKALTRMLEPDPDSRATSIGPLLDADEPKPTSRRSQEDPWDVLRESVDEIRSTGKRVRKAARREAKRKRQELRRMERGRPWHGPPVFVLLLFRIGLAIAQLVVGAVLGVLVPLVLSLLSIVFGRALRRAGEDVRRAGDHALAAIDASRTALAMQSEQGDRVRAEAKGVRVGGAPERMTEEEEQEEEAPSEPRARSRRETK
jgi:serine/threonine protein kinase